MIKINLLKSEMPRQPLMGGLAESHTGSRKLWLTLGGIAILGIVGYVGFDKWNHRTPTEVVLPEPAVLPEPDPVVVETPPEPPPVVAAAPATGDAVEDIVGELAQSAEAAPKLRGYTDLVPSERIEYQLQVIQRILKDVKAITPSDVGFAQFVFTPPGEFYIHGLAYNTQSLERFQTDLQGLQGAEIKVGKMVDVGSPSHRAREFSFYCKVNYPIPSMPATSDRVVASNKVEAALQSAVALAQTLGLTLRMPKLTGTENAGSLKRLVFATETSASFEKLQDFLEQLRATQAPLGVLRVSLRARGDEDMVADLDLVAYVGGRQGG